MDKPEWDYFEISPHVDIRLLPQDGQPGIYEPVVFVSARPTERLEGSTRPHLLTHVF